MKHFWVLVPALISIAGCTVDVLPRGTRETVFIECSGHIGKTGRKLEGTQITKNIYSVNESKSAASMILEGIEDGKFSKNEYPLSVSPYEDRVVLKTTDEQPWMNLVIEINRKTGSSQAYTGGKPVSDDEIVVAKCSRK